MIAVKDGVRFAAFQPALVRILYGLCKLSEQWAIVITSGSEGTHLPSSRHYSYEAVDVRSKQYSGEAKHKFADAIRAELGPAFTVLLEHEGGEREHLHIQPCRGTTYGVENL